MFVCLCKSVTDHQIKEAIDAGITSFDAMQTHLSVATACGSCACEVKDIIQKKLTTALSIQTGNTLPQATELFL